jgi:hypothetical protein
MSGGEFAGVAAAIIAPAGAMSGVVGIAFAGGTGP